jgi:glycosyltransferase involved in cell wall biosynthesis
MPFHRARLRQPLRQAAMCRSITHQVASFEPDVVHLQQGHMFFNLALPALRNFALVVTIHDHTPHPGDRGGAKTPQHAMNIAFRRADRVIVHAQALARDVVNLRGLKPELVHVIPHVAIGEPEPGVVTVLEREHEVLFFGRIWPYKGLEHLIKAEPLISPRIPDIRFVIAGEGEPIERYRQMMLHPQRFEVHNGYVSNARRSELFERAAVVVLPYTEASQSGVVPVAYAFGKPVVASAVGGLPEAVEHGRTGLLVPPADEHALAEALVRLLSDSAWRRRLGEAGRVKLAREWSPERVAEQTLDVYELVARRGPRGLAEAA